MSNTAILSTPTLAELEEAIESSRNWSILFTGAMTFLGWRDNPEAPVPGVVTRFKFSFLWLDQLRPVATGPGRPPEMARACNAIPLGPLKRLECSALTIVPAAVVLLDDLHPLDRLEYQRALRMALEAARSQRMQDLNLVPPGQQPS